MIRLCSTISAAGGVQVMFPADWRSAGKQDIKAERMVFIGSESTSGKRARALVSY